MKNIVVISDSHNNLPRDDAFWKILDEADYIFHLGDGILDIEKLKSVYPDKFYFVYGNCDTFSAETFEIVEVEDVKFLLTHGHKFRVKSELDELAFECNYQKVQFGLYGHTHRADITEIDGVTLINPGSIGYNDSYCYISVNKNSAVYKIVQR